VLAAVPARYLVATVYSDPSVWQFPLS